MFFEVHSEKKIGFKKLSPNDLGLKESGHQTHIGLPVGGINLVLT